MNLSLTMLLVDQTVLDEFQSQTPKKIWPVLQYSFWFTSQKMCGAFILSNYSFQFTWELKETWEKKKEWNWTNGFMWSHGKDFEIIIKFFLNKWYRFTLDLMLFLKKSFTYCVWEKISWRYGPDLDAAILFIFSSNIWWFSYKNGIFIRLWWH